MVLHQMKEELKYVSMENGELLVVNTGIEERLMLSAGNWDIAKMEVLYLLITCSLFSIVEGSAFTYSEFGDGIYQQPLWNIQCSGSENNILSCGNNYYKYCYYGRTVGIKCFSKLSTVIYMLKNTYTIQLCRYY